MTEGVSQQRVRVQTVSSLPLEPVTWVLGIAD